MSVLNRTRSPQIQQVKELSLPKVEKSTLDNGIPVFILKGGSQEIVKLDLLVKAGAIYGDHKLDAPLTALMLNEGTKDRSAQEIAEVFDFYGAYFNPTAEKDNAFAGLLSMNKHFPKTLDAFFDAITNSVFPQKEFDNILNSRLNNYLIEKEKTSFLAREAFFEKLFGNDHPYGKKSEESHYKNYTREQLDRFYKDHYQAANFQIVMSGNVGIEEMQLLNSTFGQMTVTKTNTLPEQKPFENKDNLFIIEKEDAVQSSIRMGIKSIRKGHPDYYGLKVLVTLFGGYFGSRLMKNIREEKGYTYGIHAMLVSMLDSSYLAIAADVKEDKSKETIAEIKKEIVKLQSEKVSADEISLVRNYMMGDLLQTLDGPMACSEAFKAVVQFDLDFSYFDQLKETILTISTDDIQQLAQKYLNISDMQIVVAGKY